MNRSNTRNPYFDFLRGLAIIMVVGIHTINVDTIGFESLEDICTVLLRSILNCAVPLFLAISGYFIGSRRIAFGKEHIEFLKRQVPKVYLPCLIFSLPYLFQTLYSNHHALLKPLVTFFACGFSVYYFIALIIQFYLFLPLLSKCNRNWVFISSIISFISIFIISYIININNINLPLLFYAGPFPLWILFFVMGIYLSKTSRNYSIIPPILLMAIGLFLQIEEYLFWLNRGHIVLGIKLSSFIFSTGTVWLLFARRIETQYSGNIVCNVLNWIGGISFGVYLLHCYAIMAIQRILPNLSWIATWISVLSLTVIIIWGLKSICPKFSSRYLGFR